MPGKPGKSTYSIRAVERVCDLLDLAQKMRGGFQLSDVVDATLLPKSSAFRYLSTLEGRGYVVRVPDTGLYHLGPSLTPLSATRWETLTQISRPLLEELRDEYEETVNLAVLDGTRITYLDIVDSPKSVRLSARKGDRDPLHCTALGKAIATLLPAARVRAILEVEGMDPRTETTITDMDTYFREIGSTSERGYAIDNGENEEDGRCVAVPLNGFDWPAAISISAPASRFPLVEVDAVAASLTAVAEQLRSQLPITDRA